MYNQKNIAFLESRFGFLGVRAGAALCLAVYCLAAPTANAEPTPAFDCVIDPTLTLKLGSPVTSILEAVTVERGDHVKKGQVVARLESAVEASIVALNETRAGGTAEIESKKAVLELKRNVLARKTALQLKSIGSLQDVDTARAEFRVAEQDLALADLNHRMAQLELRRSQASLEQRTIRSPIEGVVIQRSLGPGEYVRQDAFIVSIASLDPLNVETFLPVRYYGQIKVGDTAIVRPDEPLGGDRKATVTVVDQLSDAASGTFGIRLMLPNPANVMPAGFRCRVTLRLIPLRNPAHSPAIVLNNH